MHTHVSGLTLAYVFLGVAVVGTFWRLGAAFMVANRPPGSMAHNVGKAMAFQY